MKKFKFRMQKLLDIREKLELEQKNKLAKVAAEYQQVIQKQDQILVKTNDCKQKVYKDIDNGLVSIQSLRYIDQLNSQALQYVRALMPEVENKKSIMEKEREKYAQLHKDKKVLENLKKKELRKYKQIQSRIELMEMDEIAKTYSHDVSTYYES